MLAGAVPFTSVSKRAWARLFIACTLSLVLHLALLTGIPVRRAGEMTSAVSAIYARIEPVAPESVQRETPPEIDFSAPTRAKPPAPDKTKPYEPRSNLSDGTGLPIAGDPTYYAAKQLDVYPRALAPIKLDFPEAAAEARVDGQLLVLLLIDEFGFVNEASVVEARPEGYFEEAALAILRAVRFSPAQKQGRAVKSRALLQLNYSHGDPQGEVR
jgi:periplasmic protein TonB